MKYVAILSVVLASCATPKPLPKPDHTYGLKSLQERILDCHGLLRRRGASDKFAGKFCEDIFKENK
jgi:hypothetical protein